MKEKGLSSSEASQLQLKYGKNELISNKKSSFLLKIIEILKEPMFVLLIVAALIYFILGDAKDGIIMLVFVVGIIFIDIVQEWKTDKTLNALKDLSQPKIITLRDGEKKEILCCDLVPGDIIYIHEGVKIPADGYIIECNSLRVDESLLTGESHTINKSLKNESEEYFKTNYCYQGTLVVYGSAIIKIDKIGFETEYGKIGYNLDKIKDEKTLFQKQIDKLVKNCAIVAFILFLLVLSVTFINLDSLIFKDRIIQSILSALTLAMAMIPEEFPVVLTVFLSMGAWRLARKNSLVKTLPSVETLGAVSVLCVDKTGTITKNQMEVISTTGDDLVYLSTIMASACDEDTYDPMEKAMLNYAKSNKVNTKSIFKNKVIKAYPFTNETKMMANIRKIDNKTILCAKGSPESILKLCKLNKYEEKEINEKLIEFQEKGYRTIALAKKQIDNNSKIPDNLEDSLLDYVSIIALVDPPRESILNDIKICKEAGIRVVMITGDNGLTARAIAKSINMDNTDKIITGQMIDKMSDKELRESVADVCIFSRVVPSHKMRIVSAFKANGDIVAMSGDGVNDAPALKMADIGIAMGKRGTSVAREASDLVLLDDNFSTIVDTIKDGRRIYDNIRKAISYVFIIHIPIALCSLIAPMIGITTSNLLLLPVHVVLLELIIDPTCSIVLERQVSETNIMKRKPRKVNESLVNKKILFKSLIQGLAIFIASFTMYLINLKSNYLQARTIGLLIIVFSNLFLVQVNSSEYDSFLKSIKNIIKDKVVLLINLTIIVVSLLIIYTPINGILKLTSISISNLLLSILISFISVFWYELVKYFKRTQIFRLNSGL